MSTLKELFDKHGSVWLAHRDYPKDKYFKPMGYSESGNDILGESKNAFLCSSFTYDSKWFTIYEEPKPKVKRYKYAFKRYGDSIPSESNCFYKDEFEFKAECSRVEYCKRLDSTMQEFDW